MQIVAPKKAKLEEAESELRITMQILEEKRAQLAAVQAKLAKLQEDFTETEDNKQKLEAQVCQGIVLLGYNEFTDYLINSSWDNINFPPHAPFPLPLSQHACHRFKLRC
jgi:hypothetical protein